MTLTAVDVTPFCAPMGKRVSLSLGTIGGIASTNPEQRAALIAVLVKMLLEDPSLHREVLDDQHTLVRYESKRHPGGLREYMLIFGERAGEPSVAILAGFEVELADGQPFRIEVLERLAEKSKVLN